MNLLASWRPARTIWDELNQFRQEMDQVFGRWGLDIQSRPTLAVSYPAMNLWEDDESVYIEAELPGIKLEDLEITVVGEDQLAVKGSRAATQAAQAHWYRQERPVGNFDRTIALPTSVVANKVGARLENGVLSIRLPKSPAAKPTKITVKAE
jgi:HSP20 family protein